MSNMRKLVLDRIELLHEFDGGFNSKTMRWSAWWLDLKNGIVLPSKSERSNMMRLGDTTRENFYFCHS